MEGAVSKMDVAGRDKLYYCIMATSFVCDDLRLFLDTHPCDRAALEHWEKWSKIRNEAVREYTKCYGPIEMYRVDVKDKECWPWVEEPWPWEGRC